MWKGTDLGGWWHSLAGHRDDIWQGMFWGDKYLIHVHSLAPVLLQVPSIGKANPDQRGKNPIDVVQKAESPRPGLV